MAATSKRPERSLPMTSTSISSPSLIAPMPASSADDFLTILDDEGLTEFSADLGLGPDRNSRPSNACVPPGSCTSTSSTCVYIPTNSPAVVGGDENEFEAHHCLREQCDEKDRQRLVIGRRGATQAKLQSRKRTKATPTQRLLDESFERRRKFRGPRTPPLALGEVKHLLPLSPHNKLNLHGEFLDSEEMKKVDVATQILECGFAIEPKTSHINTACRSLSSELKISPDKNSEGVSGRRTKRGLGHFSLRVCEQLRKRRITSYTEVSEELVAELTQSNTNGQSKPANSSKNIRRRVYDALNVLLAIGVIKKEKKKLLWKGLPDAQLLELHRVRTICDEQSERLQRKKANLSRLLQRYTSLYNLCLRNVRFVKEKNSKSPLPSLSPVSAHVRQGVEGALHVPFVVFSTPRESDIECVISNDHLSAVISATHPIAQNDHQDIIRAMGCSVISQWDLARILPRELLPFFPSISPTRTTQSSYHRDGKL